MLLVLSAFSTSKPQSAFSNQYVLKKIFFNLSRGEIIFEAKGQLKIMGTRKFLFLFIQDTPVFSPNRNCYSAGVILDFPLIHSRLVADILTL